MKPVLDEAELDELDREQCMALLAGREVGRLAVAVPGTSPIVVPLNYALDGEAVVFRTGAGPTLRALRGTPVSFQVDEVDPRGRCGWSVLVRGRAYQTTRWETGHVSLEAWAPGDRGHWVRIVADSVSGRRIRRRGAAGTADAAPAGRP